MEGEGRKEKRAPQVRVFDNEEELSTALADYVAQLSEKSVRERGVFSIVLSGGNLTRLLRWFLCLLKIKKIGFFLSLYLLNFLGFLHIQTITNLLGLFSCVFSLMGFHRKLAKAPYVKTMDWSKWHVFWAEENVVAKKHPDSNYKQAKEGLLSKVIYLFFHMCSVLIYTLHFFC